MTNLLAAAEKILGTSGVETLLLGAVSGKLTTGVVEVVDSVYKNDGAEAVQRLLTIPQEECMRIASTLYVGGQKYASIADMGDAIYKASQLVATDFASLLETMVP